MDIDFNCPRCNQNLSVEASGAGMLVNCPKCKEQIEIPRGAVEGKEETVNPNLMQCPDCGKDWKAAAVAGLSVFRLDRPRNSLRDLLKL